MTEEINAGVISADEASGHGHLPGVGAQLRAAREARGLSVLEVANALKLGVRQLDALEDDNWEILPGVTFVRGFVRNYARLLQLDPLPLMARLDTLLEKPVMTLGENNALQTKMPQQSGSGNSRRDRAVVLSGVALVGLAALIYVLLPNDLSALRASTQELIDSFSHKEVALPTPAPAEPASEPVFPPGSTPQQVMNPQAVAPLGMVEPNVAVTPSNPVADKSAQVIGAPPIRFVIDKESWVEVKDRDGKIVFSQRSVGGSEQNVTGQGPFSLVIGYAPGVRVFWHGQAIDLVPYTRGDVARLVLE